MKKKVALIIIFNHKYDKNIEVLEKIYMGRFSNIYHLVPFYTGNRSNVIPVYDNSIYFQGYIAQGFKQFFKEEYEHYFFVADDMIINPIINETNYREHLKLDNSTSFIPGFMTLHELAYPWIRIREALAYKTKVVGIEVTNELPTFDEAIERFKKFGLEIKTINSTLIYMIGWKKCLFQLYSKIFNRKYNLNYPLVGSYSDILVVSAKNICQFCHYCGVFSATNLFAELAIPTALVLCANKINMEKDLELQGKALWFEEDYKILAPYNKNLNKLMENFPKDFLYIHPVKLSQWNVDQSNPHQ